MHQVLKIHHPDFSLFYVFVQAFTILYELSLEEGGAWSIFVRMITISIDDINLKNQTHGNKISQHFRANAALRINHRRRDLAIPFNPIRS